MDEVYLKILSDIHCEVYVDNELMAIAKKNSLTKIPLRKGEYFVQLASTTNPNYKIEQIIALEYDKVWQVAFIDYVKSHTEYIGDDDLCILNNWIVNIVTGEKIVLLDYDKVYDFSGGIALVEKNGKCGYIDINGKEVTPNLNKLTKEGLYFSKSTFQKGWHW